MDESLIKNTLLPPIDAAFLAQSLGSPNKVGVARAVLVGVHGRLWDGCEINGYRGISHICTGLDHVWKRPQDGRNVSELPYNLRETREALKVFVAHCLGGSWCLTAWLEDHDPGWARRVAIEDLYLEDFPEEIQTLRKMWVARMIRTLDHLDIFFKVDIRKFVPARSCPWPAELDPAEARRLLQKARHLLWDGYGYPAGFPSSIYLCHVLTSLENFGYSRNAACSLRGLIMSRLKDPTYKRTYHDLDGVLRGREDAAGFQIGAPASSDNVVNIVPQAVRRAWLNDLILETFEVERSRAAAAC